MLEVFFMLQACVPNVSSFFLAHAAFLGLQKDHPFVSVADECSNCFSWFELTFQVLHPLCSKHCIVMLRTYVSSVAYLNLYGAILEQWSTNRQQWWCVWGA
jgi:hypothetical protein